MSATIAQMSAALGQVPECNCRITGVCNCGLECFCFGCCSHTIEDNANFQEVLKQLGSDKAVITAAEDAVGTFTRFNDPSPPPSPPRPGPPPTPSPNPSASKFVDGYEGGKSRRNGGGGCCSKPQAS